MISNISTFFGQLFTNLGNWFSTLTTNIGQFFSTLGTNIGTFFSNLGTTIGNLFSSLFETLGSFFTNLWTWLGNLWESIKSIPSTIIEGLKTALQWLFVPSNDFFTNKVDEFKTALNQKIPYQQYIASLRDIESISDVTGDTDNITLGINLNNYSVFDRLTINMNKFIDFSIFSNYKSTWYSWVRVVTYIGLVIYNINQTIKFLRGFGITEGSIRDVQNNISNKESGEK